MRAEFFRNRNFRTFDVTKKISIQCQDNPYGFNGVMVFGDETYGMTQGCMPNMTGYNQYLTRCGNGFSAGVINADRQNDAQASRQMLPVSVAVTVSAISAPMDTQNQLGAHRMDPPFTDGYVLQPVYGWGGNGSHFWERDEQHEEEEERNLRPKQKKKKAGSRKRRRSRHAGHKKN
ncbi:hypothetical protein Q8A67_018855 [Cirrhinus molitorella]|uniref:Uncharacterized protein n=1 Tax=Cirrhinus molitorella TaxID=172907 RepID=A0AA88PH30_9TELE|nr:hypothetical protein Q8A67_018855 [Cirrhinus molitorella]